MATEQFANHPANKGLNFKFDGCISEEVLCNYLSRSLIYQDAVLKYSWLNYNEEELFSLISTLGVKYIARAGAYWNPEIADEKAFPEVKQIIDKIHDIDQDIIVEACFFENVTHDVNDIPIPNSVFETFGKKTESRNFEFDRFLFSQDGKNAHTRNWWGNNAGIPDITQDETQMLLYYRACKYIDLGYESLHIGQVHLVGREDTGWECFTKVLDMIREYARLHARRHFILINAHTHGIIDANGKLMCDFHAWPLRGVVPEDSVDHYTSEEDPQDIILEPGKLGAIYQDSLGGMTYSGWTCEHLPYIVELDNYLVAQHMKKNRNKARADFWGYDEISWFANQPDGFRRKWLKYAYNQVQRLDSNGFFEMPGRRQCAVWNGDELTDCKAYTANDFNDDRAIRDIWIDDRESRITKQIK